MRGKVSTFSPSVQVAGITPAHAGKSLPPAQSRAALRDHPRTCGEKIRPCSRGRFVLGSPPHMRGKEAGRAAPEAAGGITPAHAGKRRRHFPADDDGRDHPRTCGEKRRQDRRAGVKLGSPPHMRGKDLHRRPAWRWQGITPAHAGKRLKCTYDCIEYRDHPRTCGEKISAQVNRIRRKGSPPHMRGKAGRDVVDPRHLGITPAHAGKSFLTASKLSLLGDHPRTCGEKTDKDVGTLPFEGSPPHMRGKDTTNITIQQGVGITPAHAGKRGI